MTFIDRKTTREAQKVRNTKDPSGRRGKFETPDVPGTYLSYSQTGKSETRHETALAAALKAAGVETATQPRPKSRNPANRRRRAVAPKPERRTDPRAAMARIASASKPSDDD